jgi:hypothetical protein
LKISVIDKGNKYKNGWISTSRVSHTMGLPSCFLPTPNLYALPEFIDVNVGWPTSLARGERPGGNSEFQT